MSNAGATAFASDEAPPACLRAARPADVHRIASLVSEAAPLCVPQSAQEIAMHLEDFVVARSERGQVVGAAALCRLADGRFEVRALAVDSGWQGGGLGSRLVRHLLVNNLTAGGVAVCVTRRPHLFARLGFERIPLAAVPDKPLAPSIDQRVAMGFRRKTR